MISSGTLTGSVANSGILIASVIPTAEIKGTVSLGGGSLKNAVLTIPQDLTLEQIEQVRMNLRNVGRTVSGMTFTPYTVDEANDYAYIYDDPIIAASGAEIYNDYENNIATGAWAHAEGCKTQAIGNYSRADGWWTRADGQCAVASGLLSIASGHFSHAEGTRTLASINNAHSEGDMTQATGRQSHAEGQKTISSGFCSHAEGSATVSSGYYSHSEGWGTIAAGKNQTAMGKYNIKDTTSLLIVGNGTKDSNRKNAFKLDASGNGTFAGNVIITGAPSEDNHAITKKWLNDNIAQLILANLPVYTGEVETV